MTKVIIESAVNGRSIPTQSPYLPINRDDIIDHIIASYKAGAAIAYFHVRDIESNMSDKSKSTFREIMQRVREESDIILCPAVDIYGINEKSADFIVDCSPEMASFSLGPHLTQDFLLLKEYTSFTYPWEYSYLERSYKNCDHFSYEVMETYGRAISRSKTRPQLEIHDTGELDNVVWMLREDIIAKPLFLQFILSSGIRLNADYLIHLYDTAKEKLHEFNFAVAGAEDRQMMMAGVSLALGGHIRVGLGDSVKNAKGEPVKNSSHQVLAARDIIEGMGYEVATPNEARSILGIKGLNKM